MNNGVVDLLRSVGDERGLPPAAAQVGLIPGVAPIENFLSNLEIWHNAIPMRTQWIILIEEYPLLLKTNLLQAFEKNFGDPRNNVTSEAAEALLTDRLQRISGCVLAQGVNIPDLQTLATSQNKIFNDKQRGFIPGRISEGINSYQNLTIEFRETITSYVDFIIRPWTIFSGHYGFVARKPISERAVTKNPKDMSTTIRIFQYAKTLSGMSQVPRKIYSFYNCFPVSIGNRNLTYDTEQMETNSTQWVYSNYTISDNNNFNIADIVKQHIFWRNHGGGHKPNFEISPKNVAADNNTFDF